MKNIIFSSSSLLGRLDFEFLPPEYKSNKIEFKSVLKIKTFFLNAVYLSKSEYELNSLSQFNFLNHSWEGRGDSGEYIRTDNKIILKVKGKQAECFCDNNIKCPLGLFYSISEGISLSGKEEIITGEQKYLVNIVNNENETKIVDEKQREVIFSKNQGTISEVKIKLNGIIPDTKLKRIFNP